MPNIIQFLVQAESAYGIYEGSTSGISAVCGGADALRLLRFSFRILDVLCIVVPLILAVMIGIDIGKSVIAGNEGDMGKNLQLSIKRLIMCCALFLVPTFVNFAMSLVSTTTLKIAGANYGNCFKIAQGDSDLSQYEIKWPDRDSGKKGEVKKKRGASATITARPVEEEGDDSSESSDGGSSSSEGGDSGSSSDSDSDSDSDGGDSSSTTVTSTKNTIIISDSAYTLRDIAGTSSGGIEWIQGSPSSILASSSTKDKINAVSKNSGCKVYIAGYVSSISSTAAAQNLSDSIATLKRSLTDSSKCQFIVASVPPVDVRSSYKIKTIESINAKIRSAAGGRYTYRNIYGAIKNDCQKKCGTTVNASGGGGLDSCISSCFTGNGITFSESYYRTYYNYLMG